MKKLLPVIVMMAAMGCTHKLSPDQEWKNKQWILVEMKGVPVQLAGSSRDAHIEFQPASNQYTGTGGCNRINGNYTIDKKNKIRFTATSATKMLCSDINFENTFLETLKSVDRYTEAGQVMLLKKGDEVLLKLEIR